jgi:membrane fusion protein (multidrug efflux system)
VSENELLSYRDQIAKGQLKFPANRDFTVEVVLADGSVFPQRGHINFAAPSFDPATGTFLVRTELPNPAGTLRPGQFVRARVFGSSRPGAILIPQRAVQQGAKGHYVWVINNEGKARQRVVEVGDWHGDEWFISDGLKTGEKVVVDGAGRVTPTAPLRVANAAPAVAGADTGEAAAQGGTPAHAAR